MKIPIKKIHYLLFILLIILTACNPENGENSEKTEIPGSAERQVQEQVGGFSTATPPTFPDLRGEIIDVFFIGAMSAEFVDITESISNGLQDGFEYINANGGVFGAQLKVHFLGVVDYEDELRATYLDLLDVKPVLIILALPVSQDFYELINEKEVPILFYGLGTSGLELSEKGEDFLFWLTPLPEQQMAFVLQEIWANWEGIRPPGNFNEMRVGYLTWAETYNRLALTPKAQIFIQKHNYTLDVDREIPISVNASATNFVLEAVSKGVTVLFTDTVTVGPAVLLNDISSLGLTDFFVVSGTEWMMGSYLEKYIRGDLDIDRVYMPLSTAWWTEVDNPAIIEAGKIRSLSGSDDGRRGDYGYLLSLGAADIVASALYNAVDAKQSSEINAEDVMEYLSSLEYSVLNGLFQVNYRNGNRTVDQIRLWHYSTANGMNPVGDTVKVPSLPMIDE